MKSSFSLILSQIILTAVMFVLGVFVLTVSLIPGLFVLNHIVGMSANYPLFIKIVLTSLGISLTYLLFGFSLILVVGFLRSILNLKLKEGIFLAGSLETIKWFVLNGLFLIVRVFFMDFMMLTPLCPLFYRLMGSKVGKNVQINSKNVADFPLLEIEDNVVIGGNATVICHSFEKNGLNLKKIKIGRSAIIGLNAVVMPGCEIGEKSIIAAAAILPKDTKVESNTVYYGVNRSNG